jgi:hypothetical protein
MGASSHSHNPSVNRRASFHFYKELKTYKQEEKIEPKEHVIQHRVRVCKSKVKTKNWNRQANATSFKKASCKVSSMSYLQNSIPMRIIPSA